MSMDLRRALDDIAGAAQDAVHAVEVDRVRARVRRRRTQGVVVRSVGGLAVVGAVVASLTLLGTVPPPAGVPVETTTPSPSATPTPTVTPLAQPTTPVPGWVAGGTPCGAAYRLEPVDDPEIEVQGGVVIGTLDRATAGFAPDPDGTTLFVDVSTTSEVPGLPAGGDGLAHLTTMLLDDNGDVAFWSDPARQIPQFQATEDAHSSSMYGLYDAVDCRTGRPLTGTYRAVAVDEGGPETVELAPVTFGADGTRLPASFADSLPVCGQPVPDVTADLTVAFDPRVSLDGLPRPACTHR